MAHQEPTQQQLDRIRELVREGNTREQVVVRMVQSGYAEQWARYAIGVVISTSPKTCDACGKETPATKQVDGKALCSKCWGDEMNRQLFGS